MIKIICVGKIKEKYIIEAINEYLKRLKKYTKVEIFEVNDISIDDKQIALEKEKKLIEKYIDKKDYVISLAIEGNNITSIELAKKIDISLIEYPNITFIIGGSYGIHESIKKNSNYLLSFSKMTFPHKLFRILLLEQIYRSFKILKNESYHK
ncbi:MAG TPA: 23S rRNA (pseudouridine(1915)-N(3))-methyltransferase RlmH [Tenericutes bacterium]|nr:23S rRNA (pseudouridine(1915)-N(3))-methyltransferase RlmH [Mycoplasmatota bacterium]